MYGGEVPYCSVALFTYFKIDAMKVKHLLIMSMFVTVGCNSVPQKSYKSFDDYPVYDGEWNEMVYSPSATDFFLWAPTARTVNLLLYQNGAGGDAMQTVAMMPDKDGLWKTTVEGDLKGRFYTFNVKVGDRWLGETPGVMAKAVGVNGNRAAVIELFETNPEGWEQDVRPVLKSFSDIVIYEMHHRDFSMDSLSGIRHRGKFLALTEHGTTTPKGEKTSIDHLKELGVTHVHLLPSFDFSSVDETQPEKPQYNWGYDPKNYNVPEGSYSTDPYRPEVRIREFKQMVMALHKAGIRVIMDVVYNHTAVTEGSNFECTVPGYFYRQTPEGAFANASGCGNETASERAMMRKFMIESVCYWAKEYHVDGFRFDLMGIHDIETMNAIRKALDEIDPTIYVYGEGWAAGTPQLPQELLAMKNHISQMPGIAAFSDELRDSLRGPFGHDEQGAFIIGRPGHEAGVRFGLAGGIAHPQVNADSVHRVPRIWASEPVQFISYVSCHDDLCLADRLQVTLPGASVGERAALQKLAETAVLTSQGVPFIFAGDELMRDKKGVANSYKSPDSINAIDWRLKSIHRDVFEYVKGLIAMRKAHPAFRMGSAAKIRECMEFLPVGHDNVVAFRLDGAACGDVWKNIVVVLNARREKVSVEVPGGTYQVVCRDGKVDAVNGLGLLSGNRLAVAPRSALIVHQ